MDIFRVTLLLPALAAIPVAVAPASAEPQVARGVVYHDLNGSAQREPGEPGLAGVRVSNGVDVVATDDQGAYTLNVDDDTILFVIKPRGFATLLDPALKLPRFYYVHRPAGTPDGGFVFGGVEPTGPLPESINFPLRARTEPDRFRVVLMGDPQPYDTQEVTWYAREVAPELAGVDAAFGVALGDLVGDNLDLLQPYNEVNALAPFPWHNVIGNHDLNYEAPTDADSDDTYVRHYGPSTYAFQYGRVHFVVLNNVYWHGHKGNRKDGWPRRGQYEGRLRPEQLAFLENYVKGVPHDEAIVLCSHIPMHSPYEPTVPGQNTPQFPRVLEILSGHAHTLSFSGHTHFNYNHLAGSEQGYQPATGSKHLHYNVGTASGSWYHGPRDERGVPFGTMRDGTPRGFAIATFDGADYSIDFKPFRRDLNHQMIIHAPDVVPAAIADVQVQANVFNASDESVTRMRVLGQTDWTNMQQARLPDPDYVAMHARHQAAIAAQPDPKDAKLPEPIATDHNYVAKLPALPEGIHLIEVETTDRYGQRFTDRRPIRVVAGVEAWHALDANSVRAPRPGSAAAASGAASAE